MASFDHLEKSLYSWCWWTKNKIEVTVKYFDESAAAGRVLTAHLKQYQTMDGVALALFLILMWRSPQRQDNTYKEQLSSIYTAESCSP